MRSPYFHYLTKHAINVILNQEFITSFIQWSTLKSKYSDKYTKWVNVE